MEPVVRVVGTVVVGFVGQQANAAECGCGMLLVVCTCVRECVLHVAASRGCSEGE